MTGFEQGGSTRRRSRGKLGLIVGALAVTVAGTAVAIGVGLQNPGFEDGFGSWVVKVDRPSGNGIPADNSGKPNRSVVYGAGGTTATVVPCAPGDRYGVCLVTGDDSFVLGSGATKTVSPRYGGKMVRLGGPYTNPFQVQRPNHRFTVEQTFVVDSAASTVRLRHKLYTYDPLHFHNRFGGYDRLEIEVLDANGDPIIRRRYNTHFNHGEGQRLRATRWIKDRLELSAYAGTEVTLRVGVTGRRDELGGSWAYIDASTEPPPPLPTLTVNLAGTGTGEVHGRGISCPSACTHGYRRGRFVRLVPATTDAGSTFAGFSGACTATPCDLTMEASKTVTATFTKNVTPATDTTAPKVIGLKGPKGKVRVKSRKRKATVRFSFGADEAGSRFQCALDSGQFEPCQSPYTAKLKAGKHRLGVRAIDAASNTGPVETVSIKVSLKRH